MRRLRLTRRRGVTALLTLAATLSLGLVLAVQSASAADFHGIAFTKGCQTPVNVGDPYECGYQILNVVDSAHDTLTISSIVDTVNSAGGAVTSGNLLDLTGATLTLTGGASCDGTKCTLPFGATISTPFLSHYTVQPADYGLPNHVLTDSASLTWKDTCNSGSPNCPVGDQTSSSGSQATVQQFQSSTSTAIHNAAHQVVTAVAAGTTVHDFVTVTGQAGEPNPTGNVSIDWFTNGSCTAPPAATSAPVALDANGQADATAFSFTPTAAGQFAFQATYAGDGTYAGSVGACEPLNVVDANIQITPNGTNPVGATHVFTAHVNVNNGTGFVNAPDGTSISFTIDSGPGSFTTPNPCTTSGGTGSCQISLVSNTPGTTVVSAHTTLSVGGVTLTRNTDGSGANSGPATKLWADDTVATHVRDANGNDVTGQSVAPGTVVHDEATVAKAAGTPASVPDPTGTVDFTLYDNGTCNGNVVATDAGKPLSGGVATSATFTIPAAGGSFSYKAHYNGDANYPAHDGPCEPFTSQPPVTGQITPTQVDCSLFASGTAPTLTTINYPKSNGKIGQGIDPGVFFYWTHITTTVPNQVVTVTQSNTSTNNAALFSVAQGWDRLYTGNCSSWTAGTIIGVHNSGASFTVPTPGTYIIGIKYDVKSIAGTNVPVPATITYNFVTSLGGSTGASVVLAPK
jgi:hypothetical protein